MHKEMSRSGRAEEGGGGEKEGKSWPEKKTKTKEGNREKTKGSGKMKTFSVASSLGESARLRTKEVLPFADETKKQRVPEDG